jgi:hypothetical protein
MSKAKIFVSSTCYDLKDVRNNLKLFLKKLGFETTFS